MITSINYYGYPPGYNPQPQTKLTEYEISPIQLTKAKARYAEFISRDGVVIFREFSDGLNQANWSNESMDYESWWTPATLPNDPIDLKAQP